MVLFLRILKSYRLHDVNVRFLKTSDKPISLIVLDGLGYELAISAGEIQEVQGGKASTYRYHTNFPSLGS